MNVEITVKGITIKVQSTDRKHADKLILAAIDYENGLDFKESYLNGLEANYDRPKVKGETKQQTKNLRNFVPEVNGVKTYANGAMQYKCSYYCGCGNKGVRWLDGDEKTVKCHECKTALNVTAAHPSEAHDHEYFYFTAY